MESCVESNKKTAIVCVFVCVVDVYNAQSAPHNSIPIESLFPIFHAHLFTEMMKIDATQATITIFHI